MKTLEALEGTDLIVTVKREIPEYYTVYIEKPVHDANGIYVIDYDVLRAITVRDTITEAQLNLRVADELDEINVALDNDLEGTYNGGEA